MSVARDQGGEHQQPQAFFAAPQGLLAALGIDFDSFVWGAVDSTRTTDLCLFQQYLPLRPRLPVIFTETEGGATMMTELNWTQTDRFQTTTWADYNGHVVRVVGILEQSGGPALARAAVITGAGEVEAGSASSDESLDQAIEAAKALAISHVDAALTQATGLPGSHSAYRFHNLECRQVAPSIVARSTTLSKRRTKG